MPRPEHKYWCLLCKKYHYVYDDGRIDDGGDEIMYWIPALQSCTYGHDDDDGPPENPDLQEILSWLFVIFVISVLGWTAYQTWLWTGSWGFIGVGSLFAILVWFGIRVAKSEGESKPVTSAIKGSLIILSIIWVAGTFISYSTWYAAQAYGWWYALGWLGLFLAVTVGGLCVAVINAIGHRKQKTKTVSESTSTGSVRRYNCDTCCDTTTVLTPVLDSNALGAYKYVRVPCKNCIHKN